MSNKFLSLVVAAMLVAPLTARAGNLYLGVSLGDTNYQEPNKTFHAINLTGRAGYRLVKFFDVEARVATTTTDTTNGEDFSLRYMGSAFAKFNWQPSKSSHFELYALVGGSYLGLRTGPSGATTDDSDGSLSYGFGVDMFANDHHSLILEWVRYGDSTLNNTDYTLDNLSIGYTYHF